MRSYDVTEAQVRLNECGEGEYVSREVAEGLYRELESIYEKRYVDFEEVAASLNFADQN